MRFQKELKQIFKRAKKEQFFFDKYFNGFQIGPFFLYKDDKYFVLDKAFIRLDSYPETISNRKFNEFFEIANEVLS